MKLILWLLLFSCTKTVYLGDRTLPPDLMQTCYVDELPLVSVPKVIGWPDPSGTMISKTDGDVLVKYLQDYLAQVSAWSFKVKNCLAAKKPM